ncbi:hypothetical protein R3P38DRAFT_3167897 [Favolaschia claudopus]|uniref:Uncharacterized protein n=1 Tax=Favolaschia claudopus TaxID=2862362 RepID=A0AAW0E2P1_9AGAR
MSPVPATASVFEDTAPPPPAVGPATASVFNEQTGPPLPAVVPLYLTDLPPPPLASRPLLAHTDLLPRPVKREGSAAPSSSQSYHRAASSPLSDTYSDDSRAPFDDGPPPSVPKATTSANVETTVTPDLIPRPKAAQVALSSCDGVPDKNKIRDRISELAPTMLNQKVSYTRQQPESLLKLRNQLYKEYPHLKNYEEAWPIVVFVTAWLRTKGKR